MRGMRGIACAFLANFLIKILKIYQDNNGSEERRRAWRAFHPPEQASRCTRPPDLAKKYPPSLLNFFKKQNHTSIHVEHIRPLNWKKSSNKNISEEYSTAIEASTSMKSTKSMKTKAYWTGHHVENKQATK